MSDRTLDLLADLARLLKRYGAAEFLQLSAMLSDPVFLDSLRRALEGIAKAAPARPEKERAHDDGPLNPILAVLRGRLMDASAYPHLRDLLDEAQQLGVRVPPSGFRSRKDAVAAILKHFQQQPPAELTAAMDRLRVSGSKGSLQAWSAIITERRR